MARPIQITIMGDADQLSATLDQASEDVSAFGEKAKGLATAAGGAIALGLGAGLAEAMEREAGTDLLAAQLGASPAEAKKLGEAAGAVYSAGYGESVADANDALKNLWQQGLVPADATADEMADISKRAMDVAAVLGDEVGPTSNAVGQMLKTGLAANADEAFDILVAGTQEGANKAEDLLDTFNEYGTQFRKLGLDGQTAMGLIQQGLKGGARDADLVADTFKEFSIRAIDGSKTTAQGFKAIGLNADDMRRKIAAGGPSAQQALGMTLDKLREIKDPAERSAAAVKLFGTQAEDMGDALFSLDVDTAVDSLGKVKGAAKQAGDTMHDNAANKVKEFTRGLQTGIVDYLGSTVIPAVEGFIPTIDGVGSAFGATADFIAEHKTAFETIAGVITLVLLPALVEMGVQSGITSAKSVIAWVTTSATALTESTKQALAHAKVVAGWIAAGAQAGLNAAKVVAGWVLMGAQATIQGARMALAWILAMGPIPLLIAAIVGLVVLIVANWDTIWAYTKMVFQWLWDWVKKIFDWLKFLFLNFTGPGLIIKHWDTIWAYTKKTFQWVWDWVKRIFGWLKDLFLNFTGPGLIIKHWDTIVAKTKSAFTTVKNFARDALDAVVNFVRSLPGRISSFGGSVLSAAKSLGHSAIDGIKSGLSRLSGFASSLGAAVTSAVKSSVNNVIDLLNWAIPNSLSMGPLSIDVPDNPIPRIRAMGGPAGGRVRVGERGPEEVILPNGSTVIPNHRLGSGGGITVNVQTNADPWAIGREVAWALRTSPA